MTNRRQPRYSKGQRIGGQFLVHQALLGGMGEVYLCLDEQSMLPFALKTFQGSSPELEVAFRGEMDKWIVLEKHPNIVRCFYMEKFDNIPFMVLDQLLASGEADITASWHPAEPKPGVTVVGYEDEHFVYLLPEIAYREVMRIHPLKFSTAAIGSQLKEDDWLIPGSSDSHLTMQIRVRGRRVRVWRLEPNAFAVTPVTDVVGQLI